MGYKCSPKTVQIVVESMGYHKTCAPKKIQCDQTTDLVKFTGPRNTYEEWKRVLWADEPSFSNAGFGHQP